MEGTPIRPEPEECDICSEEARHYAGNLKSVIVFGKRHWRPVKIWSNTPVGTKKVIDPDPVWFCRRPEAEAPVIVRPGSRRGGRIPSSQE